MSITPQHPASTTLLASPTLTTGPKAPEFNVVTKGYHREEVDRFVHWALAEIEKAGRQVMSFAGHEAASPQGQRLMVEVLKIVADEALGQRQAADQEISQLIAGAREQADQILAEARAQADQTNTSASAQATSLVEGARVEAKRMTDDAAAHSAAVHEAAGARLAQFAKFHEDGMARIMQVHDKTGEMIAREQERGSLGDEVARALAPAQQASARPPR